MSVAPDQSSLSMIVGSLDGYTRSWGEGRLAVKVMSHNQDAALFSFHALSQTSPSNDAGSGPHGHGAFGTVTSDPTDGSLPVSTGWGQSTTYFALAATNDTATVASVTSTVDGPGAFTNGVACWEGGHRTGQGTITNAGPVVNGTQTFSISMFEDPDGGSNQQTFFPYFFQGGLCGTVARPKAFDKGIGMSNQALPFIGSTDAHTGVTGVHYHVGLGMVPGFSSSVFPNDPKLRDLGLYRFYSAARIVALKDPNSSAGFLGSYIGLEPHSWTAAPGDAIESPVTYSTFMTMGSELMLARLPGDHRGHDEVVGEAGIDSSFIHRHFVNLNDATAYQGMGGNIAGGPSLFDITGPYSGIYSFHNPLPGATLMSVGCSAKGCADPTSFHVLYSTPTAHGFFSDYITQYDDSKITGFRSAETIRILLNKGIQVDSAGHGVDLVNAQLHRVLTPTDPPRRRKQGLRGRLHTARRPQAHGRLCPLSIWQNLA